MPFTARRGRRPRGLSGGRGKLAGDAFHAFAAAAEDEGRQREGGQVALRRAGVFRLGRSRIGVAVARRAAGRGDAAGEHAALASQAGALVEAGAVGITLRNTPSAMALIQAD